MSVPARYALAFLAAALVAALLGAQLFGPLLGTILGACVAMFLVAYSHPGIQQMSGMEKVILVLVLLILILYVVPEVLGLRIRLH